jgi:hypothetical protein
MLMTVGSHVSLTHLNKKKTVTETERSHVNSEQPSTELPVGTMVFFVNYLENFDIQKAANNLLVLKPRSLA